VWLSSRARLPSGWILAGPSGANAELALNKYVQVEAARNAGFNVPRTAFVRTAEELREAVDAFPVILKATECVSLVNGRVRGCRKWICANAAELERACREWAERVPLFVQTFIAGTGEGVFGLAAPEGIRAWSAHRRLRMMNPQGSGSSACVAKAVPDDLKAMTSSLIAQTNWRGLFMIELLRDHEGNTWFVEMNGRPWGSMALARRQGLEYPAWHVRLLIDSLSRVGLGRMDAPGLVCRHFGRELMHLLFVLRGPRSRALRSWPSFWKAIGGVLGIRRADGIYNWRREDPKVFISDCYYTVHDNLFKGRR
jgi:biotin carboxylase